MTHDSTRSARTVLLVADPRSQAAAWVARRLSGHEFRIERTAPGQPASGLQVAGVFLLEAAVTPKLLRGLLGCVRAPTLVLAGSRELAAEVLPLLRSDDDVATLDEAQGLVEWRLRRMIERANGSGRRLSLIDPLTGLLARRGFDQQLRDACATTRVGETVGLLMIDLDRFRQVNDRYGHAAGDRALARVGELIRQRLPLGDVAGRIADDAFLLLMRRADEATVASEARGLIEAIAGLELGGPPEPDGTPSVTASGGLVFLAPDDDAAELMLAADIAMHEAKTDGRGRLVTYAELVERARKADDELGSLPFDGSGRFPTGQLVGTLATRSRRLIEQARQEANRCPLTGLYNRRYLDVQLPREIERAAIWCRPLSVALVDLDHFGEFNKVHGAPTADRVLRAFAAVASDGLRSSDWVARYGGDEFLFVMPGTGLEAARQVIERVRQMVSAKDVESLGGGRVTATISAGIVELGTEPTTAEALVYRASRTLNSAKASGRNRIASNAD